MSDYLPPIGELCCRTISDAARRGHLECMKYLHENGSWWTQDTTYIAAKNGHLECLRYIHKNSREWHPITTYFAALNGHLECLVYIYENCGDVATWDTDLEDYFEEFSKEIQAYIASVGEDWKAGLNKPGMRTKSAVRGC